MPTSSRLRSSLGGVLVAATSAPVALLMITTFLASPDHSSLGQLRWLLLGLWTLALPPMWGLRLARRLSRLARTGAPLPAAFEEALGNLWLEFTALGLGTAVSALAIVRPLL